MDQDPHAPLREDVRLLGEELGAVLREQAGDRLFDTVETIRQAAVESRSQGEVELTRLRELLGPLDDATLLEVARAFSQFLNLAEHIPELVPAGRHAVKGIQDPVAVYLLPRAPLTARPPACNEAG